MNNVKLEKKDLIIWDSIFEITNNIYFLNYIINNLLAHHFLFLGEGETNKKVCPPPHTASFVTLNYEFS